jgi:hypothetical protein
LKSQRCTRFAWSVWLAACLLSAGPRVANAALSLAGQPELSCVPGDHFFDLVFAETGPADNEGLFSYDLALSFVPLGPAGDFAFTGADRPPDNFVLDVPSGSLFRVATLTPTSLLINVASNEDLADIATGSKAARIFYTIGATPPAAYSLAFDTASTGFASADPERPLDIPVDLVDFGVVVCPEPGGVLFVAGGALIALWRRGRLVPA